MTAKSALIDLVVRLGAELEFDVAKDVLGQQGETLDVVWFDRTLPICAVGADALDLRHAPVLPVAAFDIAAACELEPDRFPATLARLDANGIPLLMIVVCSGGKQTALSPALRSVDSMQTEDGETVLCSRIAEALGARPHARGRTIVMAQQELVDWARRLRDAKPRSYSAESLFHRTGVID